MGYADYGSPSTSAARIQFEHSNHDIHEARNEWSSRHWFMIAIVLLVAAAISVGVVVTAASSEKKEEPLAPVESNAVGQTSHVPSEKETPRPLVSAAEILQQVPLIDGHNDWPWNIRRNIQNRLQEIDLSKDLSKIKPWGSSPWSHTDIPRLRKGRVGAQFWAAFVQCESQYLNAVQLTLEQIDVIKRFTNKYHKHFKFATSAKEIEEAFSEGKIASLIGIEGGHSIGNSLAVLRMFYDLGVRYLTLTHNCHTPWADSHLADRERRPVHHGLTRFGKTVVLEMNRLGMMVDLAHVSVDTMHSVMDISRAPVIFSHSSAYSICNSTRNVRDDTLRRVSRINGIVMVNFYGPHISCGDTATLSQVADHIDHIRNVAGVNHVGIGGDFDGIDRVPIGLEDVSKYPDLLAELASRGWSEEDLKKLAGLNLLRVLKKVEEVRDQIRKAGMPPFEDLISPKDLDDDKCTFDFL